MDLSSLPAFYVLALELERAASRRDDAPARDASPPPHPNSTGARLEGVPAGAGFELAPEARP